MNDVVSKAALGFLLFLVAGGLNSSFALPLKKTSKWAWENTWLVYSIVGMIVLNWAIAYWTVPHLGTVYAQAGWRAASMVIFFGIIWGVADVLLGHGFDLDGKVTVMEQGDTMTVNRFAKHRFTALIDSLILECSKPDLVDDSIFEDAKINAIIFGDV